MPIFQLLKKILFSLIRRTPNPTHFTICFDHFPYSCHYITWSYPGQSLVVGLFITSKQILIFDDNDSIDITSYTQNPQLWKMSSMKYILYDIRQLEWYNRWLGPIWIFVHYHTGTILTLVWIFKYIVILRFWLHKREVWGPLVGVKFYQGNYWQHDSL